MTTPGSSTTEQSLAEPTPLVQTRLTNYLANFPWWGLFVALIAVFLLYSFMTDATYKEIIRYVFVGIRLTVFVTLVSFALSLIIGLITAFALMGENVIAKNLATLYVQLVRGIPMLVLIFYTALVIVPVMVGLISSFGAWLANIGVLPADNILSSLQLRDVDFLIRGIIALAINYGAFSAEVFRAGIQSIEKGQLEASRALGLKWTSSLMI